MNELRKGVLCGDLSLVNLLINAGLNIEEEDKFGRTVLFDAVISNNIQMVDLLLSKNCIVDHQDKTGKTPLFYSVQEGNFDMSEYLIKHKANVHVKDNFGNSIITEAVFYSKGKGEIIQLLIDNNADPTAKNNYGISAKDLASTIANFDVKKYFK